MENPTYSVPLNNQLNNHVYAQTDGCSDRSLSVKHDTLQGNNDYQKLDHYTETSDSSKLAAEADTSLSARPAHSYDKPQKNDYETVPDPTDPHYDTPKGNVLYHSKDTDVQREKPNYEMVGHVYEEPTNVT